jgi:hypothetical protein
MCGHQDLITGQEVFPTRTGGWSALHDVVGGQVGAMTRKDRTLFIAIAPFPQGIGASYAQAAIRTAAQPRGAYSGQWEAYGAKLQARHNQGWTKQVVALAWEYNCEGCNYWGSNTFASAAQYIAACQNIIDSIRVTYPAVQTAQIANGWGTPRYAAGDGAWSMYWGDSYTTYFGGDYYDHYNELDQNSSDADFTTRANLADGPLWLCLRCGPPDRTRRVGRRSSR